MATTTTTEFIRELHQWFENGGGALSPNALYTGPSGGDNATWRDVLAAIVAEQQPAGPTTVYVILRAGTAEYLAPEIVLGQACGPGVDLWSWASCCTRCWWARRPSGTSPRRRCTS